MKLLISYLVVIFTGIFSVSAQQFGIVRGKITDKAGTAINAATISLLNASDSSTIKLEVADANGQFQMDNIQKGNYLLNISAIGYESYTGTTFTITEQNREYLPETIVLNVDGKTMGAVTVTARKPMIEVRADRTIVNVDASVTNVGATALEVLEKSPGVSVTRDGVISIKGKQGVLVLIDGKPSYLSPADLASLLGSMTANQLDQIEIMPNPPAKYDAAGNAGVINIKTKKNKQKGFNGNISLNYGHGVYYKTNNSLNLNYRNNKLNLFLNYSNNYFKGFSNLHINRTYYAADNKTILSLFEQPTRMVFEGKNHTVKLGFDYNLSKKTTIGLTGNGFISPRNFNGGSTGYLKDKSGHVDSSANTISNNANQWNNGAITASFRHQFSSSEELTADLDLIRYDISSTQLFTNRIQYPDGSLVSSNRLRGNLPSEISIYSAKTDYSKTFTSGLKLDAGVKTSLVKTDNTADYSINYTGTWNPDYGKSNHFLYEENINAAYVNLNKKTGKWNLQGGLRYENTSYKGNQLGNPQRNDSSFERKYNSLFPTVFISYETDSNHTFTLSSGRRIGRPAYQQLNPFLFFINEFTYQQGNPFLAPQYTHNLEFAHTYKGFLTSTISFSETRAFFSQVFATDRETTIVSEGNIGRMQNVGISISAQLTPTSWWNLSATATINHRKVDGNASGTLVNTESINGQMNINNQFRLKKGWGFELSGFYNTPNKEAQFDIDGFGQVSAGVSKQVLDNKGSIKLNIRDMFFTQVINGEIVYGNVKEHFSQNRDTRVINLAFTYRFGKTFKENPKRNGGSASDEQRRVGGN